MPTNRRKFIRNAALGLGMSLGATTWLATSKRRAARVVRMLIADARRPILPAPVIPTPEQWSDNAITMSWLGHTTVLMNFFGIWILTDPVLGNRIGVSLGLGTAGPKRFISPALPFKRLPPIDVVLLSHAHMDHMDLPTLQRFRTKIFGVTAKATTDVLSGTPLAHATELAWGERTTFKNGKGELEIQAIEVNHWGQRWPSELERGYNGYILRREGKSILFGGDTAHTLLFSEIRARGPFEAAIMPIGAYDPWIWNHCTPEEAIEMANRAGARYIVPVHHQTFKLSDEPMHQPIERFEEALSKEPERIALRKIGETFVCPKA